MKRDLTETHTGALGRRVVAEAMPSPVELRGQLPGNACTVASVAEGRRMLTEILDRNDPRWVVIVGPCSIHDPVAALDYAQRLRQLAEDVSDTLVLVMRAYFEKPRTTIGWKGLINDPHLDGSCRMGEGMYLARDTLLQLGGLGLPVATEALDLFSMAYLGDLVSWAAIGARTTESQPHREMSSGLPMPVGFKNGTDGNVEVAIHAMGAAARSHTYLGMDEDGRMAILRSSGNPFGHLILRGGGRPNYDAVSIRHAEQTMIRHQVPANIVVDCAHGNSNKQPQRQPLVMMDVVSQIEQGNRSIVGVMIESFLEAGSQAIQPDRDRMKYGCSVTDACIDWHTTEQLVRQAHRRLRPLLAQRFLHTAA
ncbi:3-deoxy-7-phosphoheptulonate synthase [Chitinivorax tropicus]|uniref:Phospho-2-dehydro-3-deoxyheptonate aldolase n=1 Tax=Chitinivorax tropicus TaxID=714531 RepID=A0A840MMT4_9PROT|nr:3-deoxy-7-phosphoheptulonate synthase [Chitinivorax tropicus]MBB5018775.1 3-deoxy-7-phosphoheptulonate synthase [Chitinivorax tropicus]